MCSNRRHRTPATTAWLIAAVLLLALSACSEGSDSADDEVETSTTPTTTTETSAPVEPGTTPPGTELEVGQRAVVRYTANPKHDSLVSLIVSKVRQGKPKDLAQFDPAPAVRNSGIYYVNVIVRNTGSGDLGGQPISLYGQVSEDKVVPPVTFGSTFAPCDYQPLPKPFSKNAKTNVCVAMLAPHQGKISEVQWRPADNSEPISWSLR